MQFLRIEYGGLHKVILKVRLIQEELISPQFSNWGPTDTSQGVPSEHKAQGKYDASPVSVYSV